MLVVRAPCQTNNFANPEEEQQVEEHHQLEPELEEIGAPRVAEVEPLSDDAAAALVPVHEDAESSPVWKGFS